MQITKAARAKVLGDPGFTDLLGSDVGMFEAPAPIAPWVFQEADDSSVPAADIQKSGTSAVVFGLRRSSMVPSRSSMRFTRLTCAVWSDVTRGNDMLVTPDARDRCERVANAIVAALHEVGDRGGYWGEQYVIACELASDLQMLDVPHMSDVVRGELAFDVAYA